MRPMAFKLFPPLKTTLAVSRFHADQAASISLYLDHEIVEFRRTLKQELMRYPGRNADNISSRKLSPDATLDCAVALFMGSHSLSIHQRTADHQDCRAGLNKEDVNLSFVPLGLAVGRPMHQH